MINRDWLLKLFQEAGEDGDEAGGSGNTGGGGNGNEVEGEEGQAKGEQESEGEQELEQEQEQEQESGDVGGSDNEGSDDEGSEENGEGSDDGPPEDYEFKIPEDLKGLVNDEILDEFKNRAKELGLSQEAAQSLIDFEVERQQRTLEAYNEQIEQWAEITKSDSEIGGADFEKKIAKAHQAFESLASDGLKKLMDPYHPTENPTGLGLGNHPEIVRLFYRLGVNMGEDGLKLANADGAPAKLDRLETLYGDTN